MSKPLFQARSTKVALLFITGAVALTQLTACLPLVAVGALSGTLAATDRRTLGTQLEDRQIQMKAESSIEKQVQWAHVNVTTYNRKVLLTGEVPNEEARKRAEATANSVDNVAAVVNELEIAGPSSLTSRTADSTITAKVKAVFVDDAQIMANAFKVTTERGTVFLMGRVTQEEGERAAQAASKVGGVARVIKVLDYISEEELGRLRNQPAPTPPRATSDPK